MRSAKDVDVLANIGAANSVRLSNALIDIIGVAHPNLTRNQIEGRKRQINFEAWGYFFEVLTAADGVDFTEVYARRATAHLGALEVPVIAKAELIEMKQGAGRAQDSEDVRVLVTVYQAVAADGQTAA